MRRSLRALLAIALLAAVPAIASANGRKPQTNGIYLRPGDAQSLYVRSTFGLLISHDDGCSFRWVCEDAIGYGGEFDPKYAIAADGTIFATTFEGLRVSRDSGCTWETATSGLPTSDPNRIADLWIDALDIAPNGDVWVATAETGRANDVFRSTDQGRTFAPRGLSSPTIWWKSLRIARSNPQRIYVTGYQVAPEPRAFLRRSDNGGTTWIDKPLPSTIQYGPTPLVVVTAVDPMRPDVFYLTSVESVVPNKGAHIYRSTDGGDTFTEVVTTNDPVTDIVFRASGTVLVATIASGTFESGPGGAAPYTRLFTAQPNSPDVVAPQHGCLVERPNGELVGCGANWQPDYMAVGKATNPLEWTKVFRFVELAGTVECPAGTTAATKCDPMWSSLKEQFGATGPTCFLPPHADGPPPRKSGGCCEAGNGANGLLLGVGLGALLLRRRRR